MHRVLIVDDDTAIRGLLHEVLSEEGYEVLEAANGAEAVKLARERRPHLVIMDLRMPVMNGVEAIRAMRSDPALGKLRILAMSAGTVLRAEAIKLPVNGLIDKPFDLDALLARVAFSLRETAPA